MGYPLLTLCLLVALSINVKAWDAGAIIGRTNVLKPVKYLVTIKREGKPVCRGGIIGSQVILTAASCFLDKTFNDFIPGSLSVIAGYDNATVVADVAKIYIPKGEVNIAVLKLKQQINLHDSRKPLQRLSLPKKIRGGIYKNYLNKKVKIATFDEDDSITFPYLLGVKVTDEVQCIKRWNRYVQTTELCAKIEDEGYAPMRVCDTDLGTPLVFYNKVIIGITIVPPNRCVLNGEPFIYTRVSSFVPFIKAVIEVRARMNGEEIVGGVATERHEIKYQISMQVLGIEWCGGSIIDEKFVLTAAHCVVDEDNEFLIHYPFKVVAGINDVNDEDEDKIEVDVEKIYIPATYSKQTKTSVGDIAVVKVKQKFDLGPNSNLKKLALPPSTEKRLTCMNSYVDTEPLISGFGWDEVTLIPHQTADNKTKYEEDGTAKGKLLKAKALVIANSECQIFYKKYVIHDSQICAKLIQHPVNVHQGVCSGDSGSPLVLKDVQIGLVSFNYLGCNDRKRPAVYTRISAYINFINKAKRDNVTVDMRSQVWSDDT
ncbi:uncharacterized protein LOC131667208 [Phymastichus coffea]|uniref:uncharacterized protein LOC131667208 n=1 Tax=Phymastichus coffea TaxID=108790 RepID=UPI00273B8CCA|nr:uncharacterized protein LOC131667208 [Phymastichus coffea]